MLIALPSGVKVFNWTATLWQANIRFTTAMLNAIAFVTMFIIGGLSGLFMASTAVDVYIHDTYFIVAHIHYVLFGGTMFGIFAAIYHWFPKMFGRQMSEFWGKVHFVLTFLAFNGTFFAMHILGMGGHMRRIANPLHYEFLRPLQPLNQLISFSAFALGAAQVIFLLNFFGSMFFGRKAEANPWRANTLEWTIPSPPPYYNYERTPRVYRGPYEYSPPESKETDHLPQTAEPVGAHSGP
jgi:cytochrome c oxidase subunit 1